MKKAVLAAFVLSMVCTSGCANKIVQQRDWAAVGGSKSDATVRLEVVWYPQSEVATFSDQQALELALQKCRTWGYTGAEPFGQPLDHCTQRGDTPNYGLFGLFGGTGQPICYEMTTEREYQCIGETR